MLSVLVRFGFVLGLAPLVLLTKPGTSSYVRPFALCCINVDEFSTNAVVLGDHCDYPPSVKSELVGACCVDKTSDSWSVYRLRIITLDDTLKA